MSISQWWKSYMDAQIYCPGSFSNMASPNLSLQVASQCKENIFVIKTLRDFQYMEEGKDQGFNVREKAKALVTLLGDDERLRNERARQLKARERFARSVASSGFGSEGSSVSEEVKSVFFLTCIECNMLCFSGGYHYFYTLDFLQRGVSSTLGAEHPKYDICYSCALIIIWIHVKSSHTFQVLC